MQKENLSRSRASSKDILGGIGGMNGDHKIKSKWLRHYQHLVELREQMERRKDRLVEVAKEEQPVYGLHMGEAGTDQYDLDFALGMISVNQNAFYEIEEALNRIKNGSYGICELTGKLIEPERLTAIPWTRFSTEAQRQLEQEGC